VDISDRELHLLVVDLMSFAHLFALIKTGGASTAEWLTSEPALLIMAEDRMRDVIENLAPYRDVTLGELMEKMAAKHETGRKEEPVPGNGSD
jgi:hypothetical protein